MQQIRSADQVLWRYRALPRWDRRGRTHRFQRARCALPSSLLITKKKKMFFFFSFLDSSSQLTLFNGVVPAWAMQKGVHTQSPCLRPTITAPHRPCHPSQTKKEKLFFSFFFFFFSFFLSGCVAGSMPGFLVGSKQTNPMQLRHLVGVLSPGKPTHAT